MKFNNKETYLEYRSNWKSEYNTLSKQIRALKKTTRESGHQITWQECRELKQLKEKATYMLIQREESKVEAQNQYMSAHNQELVTA
jgi:exoribonuclease II